MTYFKGARQRHETIVTWPPKVAAVNGRTQSRVNWTLVQCDQKRTATLNEEAKTYAYWPLENLASPVRHLSPSAATRQTPDTTTDGGDVRITIDAVDTGQRRQVGHYVARHVITTTTTEPGPGAHTPARVTERDGWYLDLPSASCRDQTDGTNAFLITTTQLRDTPPDRLHLKQRGTARRGFAIEEITRGRGPTEPGYTSHLEMLELADGRLDVTLFDVPPGYHSALPRLFGGYDLSKADTLPNRVQEYWQELSAWATHLFR